MSTEACLTGSARGMQAAAPAPLSAFWTCAPTDLTDSSMLHSGEILGAAAYPVRDRFQLVGEGGTVNFHGPVRCEGAYLYAVAGSGSVLKPTLC